MGVNLIPTLVALNYSDFLSKIHEISTYYSSMDDSDNIEIWYRGVSRSDYFLEPSIYHCQVIIEEEGDYKIIDEINRIKCNFITEGVHLIKSEHMNDMYFNQSDLYTWLKIMQHYGAPTNILDFSRKANVSLYFALEDYFYNKEYDGHSVPCVWVLIPSRLNGRIKYKIRNRFQNTSENNGIPTFEDIKTNYKNDFINFHCAVQAVYDSKNILSQSGVFVNFPVNISKKQIKLNRLDCQKNADKYLIKILLKNPERFVSDLWVTGERPWSFFPHLDIIGKVLGSNRSRYL